MNDQLKTSIDLLSHRLSAKRRSGAKRLRKLADPLAGPTLVSALENELKDQRTWETQYQMIIAIGHCRYLDALPFIKSLAEQGLGHTAGGMVDMAIGDTLVRLTQERGQEVDTYRTIVQDGVANQICGAAEAIAMLRLVPDESGLHYLTDHRVSLHLPADTWTIIWLLRAAPGWPDEFVESLITKWGDVSFENDQQIHGAIELLRKRKYAKWSPL